MLFLRPSKYGIELFCLSSYDVVMKEKIVVNPDVHFGKPCVAGTRIPVHNVLELVREGIAFDVIISDFYPDLTPEDIRACLQYAIDIVTSEDIHIASVAA